MAASPAQTRIQPGIAGCYIDRDPVIAAQRVLAKYFDDRKIVDGRFSIWNERLLANKKWHDPKIIPFS